jgi:hypothetical protein
VITGSASAGPRVRVWILMLSRAPVSPARDIADHLRRHQVYLVVGHGEGSAVHVLLGLMMTANEPGGTAVPALLRRS